MKKIKILDPLTANQIAAGEVVERPVSVVKELIENAIDAGSTRVKITVWEGGMKRIQVSDNGCGISPGDLNIAILRHATSKIETVQDLNCLHTLGFRGEALPSIAAVSKLAITSRLQNSSVGYMIQVKDGHSGEISEIGTPVGTEVTVDQLFYNTPARKKFLKTPVTELGQISDLVGRMALSRPDISFALMDEKKVILKSPGNSDLAQAIYAVYGGEIARNMKEISHEGFPRISGFVTLPQSTRSSRHYYNFFINGRWVKSQELASSLEEAYHTRIPDKRFPVAVIHLVLDPELFDVNVHPAKLEIKFKDISPIKEALLRSVQSVFAVPSNSIPQIYAPPVNHKKLPEAPKQVYDQITLIEETKDAHHPYSFADQEAAVPKVSEIPSEKYPEEFKEIAAPFFSSLKILGQLEGTYIIASGDEGLYIIDQHAAHERIRYEKIKKIFSEQPSATNILAVPIPVELTHQQAGWLIEHILHLTDLGFVLEHFGDHTFLLRGVPRWHLEGNSHELLLDILEKLGNDKEFFTNDTLMEEKLFSLACKSSVKANRYLTESDIRFLLQHLDSVDNPLSCPHGRPVLIKLTHAEIKRRFFRT
ncbi:DNA mismatch repair endonuclease MutL [Candidatus Formimonas warabiya]|uniref:DNA mismatch repair protein MutL n=1 Tax=Formimonas warabiya TaxID=1761012 RepID=A0A3G1KP71_FORW1|nr:DNA mismatch repair endonuclease MutL [Candidatus Formimonas warabiya]ATW24248.1 hypothetical protein DCMF_05120 [Candidatus Formimonas warabiya]